MKKIKEIKKINMYLIPIFLGIAVFMQSELFPDFSNGDIESQINGVNAYMMLTLFMITIMFITILPKRHFFLRLIKKIFRRNWEKKVIETLSTKIDIIASYIVYYVFMIALFALCILSIIVVSW